MNSNDTIKALGPIVSSYFRGGVSAEDALDLIGSFFKESTPYLSHNRRIPSTPAGYCVTDRSGQPSLYPTAADFEVTDDGRLMIRDSGTTVLAIYNKLMWTSVERISA